MFCLHAMYVSSRARMLQRKRLRWFLIQARRWVFAIRSRLARFWLYFRWGTLQGSPAMVVLASKGSGPAAYPLTSLEQLKEQSLYSSRSFEFLKSSVALVPSSSHGWSTKWPRLLVCHDYKGGYQEDKWVQGQVGMEGYVLWHWHLIDVFVYFSHSLVTVPPPGWINAAHKHGVQVLGTFITEWGHGASVCRSLLSTAETSCLYASRLAELAHALGFDGWLINIENVVDKKDIPRLHLFVQHLRQCMHALVPNSHVIWYDAVTEEGKLDWQNCLNEQNRFFFDDSDGLFTNYTWTEGMAKLSAHTAGERAADVYMGVDVFGRNTFGGGGFNCDIALKVSREANVSAALFAPGWVYETNQPPSFEVAQTRWWSTIEQCWPIAHLTPTSLPFFSDFNRGCGSRVSVDGEEVSTQPWFNLSCQNLQPILRVISKSQHPPQQRPLQVSLSHEAAYSGGSCLRISGSDSLGLVQLYEAHLPVAGTPLHIAHSVLRENQLQVSLALRIRRGDLWYLVLLIGDDEEVETPPPLQKLLVQPPAHNINSNAVPARNSKWTVRNHVVDLGACILTQIYAVAYSDKLDGERLLSLIEDNDQTSNGMTAPDTGPATTDGGEDLHRVLLGHVRIAASPQHDIVLPTIVFEGCHPDWMQAADAQKSVSLTLRWGLDFQGGNQGSCRWVQYSVYVTKEHTDLGTGPEDGLASAPEFLGVAVVQAFCVENLLVPSSCNRLEFCVQAQCACGVSETFAHSPRCSVDLSLVASEHCAPDSDPSQPLLSKTEDAV